jgi:flagellar assembly factor FliW
MTAALAYDVPAMITVTSDLLGTLTIPADSVITFPTGILGFPECHSFVLLPSEREHLYWLQSTDYSTLAFLVVDPFVVFPGYTVDLATTDLGRVATSPDQVMVVAIVTLPTPPFTTATANLQGPLIINTHTKQGYQAVLSDNPASLRAPFTL